MATRFELVLYGGNPVALRAAGEEALDEIERLHRQLSLYEPTSDIARINALAAREPVRVDPRVFKLLQWARKLYDETAGLFDITIAPLMRCWGFMAKQGALPDPAQLAEARSKVGMNLVELDPANFTVRFARPGVMLDLGAIGKGYAVEQAGILLREAGVSSAFLHGGTSSVYALGTPPDAPAWKVALDYPQQNWQESSQSTLGNLSTLTSQPSTLSMTVVSLKDESLSVSAVWGRFFQANRNTYGHILDPRTGEPVSGPLLAAVVLPSATETDALSTALLAAGINGQPAIQALRPAMRSLVVETGTTHKPFRISSRGIQLLPTA